MNKEIFDLSNCEYELTEVSEKNEYEHDTMDIEVENTHYYLLENGIISHNSISTIAQTTSGIEPVFMISYKRRRKVNPNEEGVKVDYTDQNGDSWEEYNVLHPQFIKWVHEMLPYGLNEYLKENNLEYTIINTKKYLENLEEDQINELKQKSPWENAQSHNIDYYEKVTMQGKIQKYIDHSISVCLSKDTLIDTHEGLYYLDELTDFSKINVDEFKKNDHFEGKVLTHKNKRKKIKSFYNNGKKPVGKIKLKNGLSIKSTLNEKYLKSNEETNDVEWVMLSELELGDKIMVKNQMKKLMM